MAGPYEDPMAGQMPANPGGGGMPGQPRNPAAGGYPGANTPLQPGQVPGRYNPDGIAAKLAPNMDWMRMRYQQRFPNPWMTGGPGMWGGGMGPGFDPVQGGAVPGQRPDVPMEPDMTSKADELGRYKDQLQFQKNYGIRPFMGTPPPDWMSEDRAGRIAGRIGARPADPKYPGGFPTPMPRPAPSLPPWFSGPTGGLFGPGVPYGGGMAQPYGGGAMPPVSPGGDPSQSKPGSPPQYGPAGAPTQEQMTGLESLRQNQMQPA